MKTASEMKKTSKYVLKPEDKLKNIAYKIKMTSKMKTWRKWFENIVLHTLHSNPIPTNLGLPEIGSALHQLVLSFFCKCHINVPVI